jgi:hypothetical protein
MLEPGKVSVVDAAEHGQHMQLLAHLRDLDVPRLV